MQPTRFALLLLLLRLSMIAMPDEALCEEPAVLEISYDTVLDPGRTYGRIVIKASNITVDGRGARLIGKRDGDPKYFTGTAVLAEKVSNVKLSNIHAKGGRQVWSFATDGIGRSKHATSRTISTIRISAGANDNRFVRNSCSHGGDGLFIRVLNGWVSAGDVFEENDCSYADNTFQILASSS